jgi:two-component system nitrogen regulation response regulator GlnG
MEGRTLPPIDDDPTAEEAPVPALTIVWHPWPERVGERLLLSELSRGGEVRLSRLEGEFQRPSSVLGTGATLGDPYLTRNALVFKAVPGGGIRLTPERDCRVAIAEEPLQAARELSPEELIQGVPLELARRVVLLLHLADPHPAGAMDALGMVGNSRGIQAVRRDIESVAGLSDAVLIRGETGTGKELVARAIHLNSQRSDKPFVSVNLGAIPKELAAAELFGALKGAFTGAERDRKGYFQQAKGGTLFLDEVGESSPEVQVMLLRALEAREIQPLGAARPEPTDVRLIAATDANLEKQILEGNFRNPLLQRLGRFVIRIPPLRERREDIGPLFHHFAREALKEIGDVEKLGPPKNVMDKAWLSTHIASLLVRCRWPGNIRQLSNVTSQLVKRNRGKPSLTLDAELEKELRDFELEPPPPPPPPPTRKKHPYTEEEIIEAFEACGWKIKPAAEKLGIPRITLNDRLKRQPGYHAADALSEEAVRTCHQECQGDLEEMTRRLKVERWALVMRLNELKLRFRELTLKLQHEAD